MTFWSEAITIPPTGANENVASARTRGPKATKKITTITNFFISGSFRKLRPRARNCVEAARYLAGSKSVAAAIDPTSGKEIRFRSFIAEDTRQLAQCIHIETAASD